MNDFGYGSSAAGADTSGESGWAWVNLSANDEPERMLVQKVMPPVPVTELWAIGMNYAAHAEEVGLPLPKFPVAFPVATSAVVGHGHATIIPDMAKEEIDYEGELAVVIGAVAKNVPVEEALNYVAGYTAANDFTARRWQGKKNAGQYGFSKSFDGFKPIGQHLTPADEVSDPQNLNIRTYVNGECVQNSNTSEMIFSVAQIISHLSQFVTLQPGTVILTGSPPGVGYRKGKFLKPGDEVIVDIEGISSLRSVMVADER